GEARDIAGCNRKRRPYRRGPEAGVMECDSFGGELIEGGGDQAGRDARPAQRGRPNMLDSKSAPKKRTRSERQPEGSRTERMRPAPKATGIRSFLNVNPEQQFEIVRG